VKLGFELPNEDRALTGEEVDKLRAIGAEVVRLRYVREDVVLQCLEVNPGMVFIVRPPWDGKIEPEKWGKALADGTKLIANIGGKPLQNLVNEPNHPDGPYADNPGSFGPDYDALKSATWKDTSWLTVSPNLTVKANDIEWAKRYKEQFAASLCIGFSDYWQYENELSLDWGLRVTQFRKIWPASRFIALEVGDSTDEELRTSTERAEHIARNLIALAKLGYVDMACIFMLGGTDQWRKFLLSVEDCRYIREEFDLRATKEDEPMPDPKTIGDRIVAEARLWIDVLTYEWGDKTTEDDPGMDCSGFVDMCVALVTGGPIAEGGGTWCQWQECLKAGTEILFPQMQNGDIVFWDGGLNYPTHIGIATGDGTIIDLSLAENTVKERPIIAWDNNWWGVWRMPWGTPEPTPEPVDPCRELRQRVAELDAEASQLAQADAEKETRIAELEAELASLRTSIASALADLDKGRAKLEATDP